MFKSRLLCIDDDPLVLATLNEQLGDFYQVYSCTDPTEALNVALRTVPDLILLDLSMPYVDGTAVHELLKGFSGTRHIPVVAYSSEVNPATLETLMAQGLRALIDKETNTDELREQIAYVLTHSQPR